MSLPGCPDSCGNTTVPYPFGIGAGCYYGDPDGRFHLDCDYTASSSSTQGRRLRLSDHANGNEVLDISLSPAQARVYINATRGCFDAEGRDTGRRAGPPGLSNVGRYLYSAVRNKLVVLGCNYLGYLFDTGTIYLGSCMSVCLPTPSGSVTTYCQGTVASGEGAMGSYAASLVYYPQVTSTIGFMKVRTSCGYAFLADAGWFADNSDAYFNRSDDFSVPVSLDWYIDAYRVLDCSQGKQNMTTYACRGNSDCIDTVGGSGYLCNCSAGYEGNPYLEDGCFDIDECQRKDMYPCFGICANTVGSYNCTCPTGTSGDAYTINGCRRKDRFTLAVKIVIGVSAGVMLLALMCSLVYLGIQKRKLIKAKRKFFEQNGGLFLQQQLGTLSLRGAGSAFRMFTKEELEKATNNFDDGRVLGRGGHGVVYKGVLEDKRVVAIKRSKVMEESETKEFAKEMLILSQINHRNIVKLLGCCFEVEVPMLVYEFVSNGTLQHHIHGRGSVLPVDARLRIAAESAEALSYMHSSASPPILHGDVKPANILIDDRYTAKVSDFGASKFVPNDEADIATLVQGTCGYLDPEYLATCMLTDKSDVYSFGVVILELVTRKKVIYFDGPEEDRSLVSRFLTASKANRFLEILDKQMRDECKVEVLQEIEDLIWRCLSLSGEDRPEMRQVAETLGRLRKDQQDLVAGDGGTDTDETALLASNDTWITDMEQGSSYYTSMHIINLEG